MWYDQTEQKSLEGTQMRQGTLSDIEYSNRKRRTKREEFLDIMDEIIP